MSLLRGVTSSSCACAQTQENGSGADLEQMKNNQTQSDIEEFLEIVGKDAPIMEFEEFYGMPNNAETRQKLYEFLKRRYAKIMAEATAETQPLPPLPEFDMHIEWVKPKCRSVS